jgi:hypothetical protein
MTASTSEVRTLEIRKSGGGWRLTASAGASIAYRTQAEAITAARGRLAREGGVLTVVEPSGRSKHMTVLGGNAARSLNAVEGIAPNARSRRLIEQLTGAAQTPAQRRAAVLGHFRKG